MAGNGTYFNFPIVLLKGFLVDRKKCLEDIVAYAVYAKTLTYDCDYKEDIEKVEFAEEFFKIECYNKQEIFDKGEAIFNSLPFGLPFTGINVSTFYDYLNNYKSEFESVCLLGYLALKSIVQKQAYTKTTNQYWFARMDGKVKAVSTEAELSPEIRKYLTKYQTQKIKDELILNWGLKHYSRYTRGFYISYTLSLDDLVYAAEKRRKKQRLKEHKNKEKNAVQKALSKLNENG